MPIGPLSRWRALQGSNEGIMHTSLPWFTAQFHPEAKENFPAVRTQSTFARLMLRRAEARSTPSDLRGQQVTSVISSILWLAVRSLGYIVPLRAVRDGDGRPRTTKAVECNGLAFLHSCSSPGRLSFDYPCSGRLGTLPFASRKASTRRRRSSHSLGSCC